MSFNSRARKGRDLLINVILLNPDAVSIHAPARGATRRSWGKETKKWFQFTRPQGARHVLHVRIVDRVVVSIHAPARGATASFVSARRDCSFNSRARKGRDAQSP